MTDKIERRHRYRLTKVTTEDYGDGPHAGQFAIGELSVIPDGSFWRDRPQTLNIGVPLGTRPGAEFEVTIAALADKPVGGE